MRKPILTILFALALVVANAAAEDSPISVSLAIPAHNGERRIDNVEYINIENFVYGEQKNTAHFHVIVSNTSDKQQRIWWEGSWGSPGLTFELIDQSGKKWIAREQEHDRTFNPPLWWTLEQHESFVIDVNFADTNKWVGFPSPTNGSQTVTMQAVLEFKPDDEARQHDIWTGRVVSKAEKVIFYHWKSDAK